MCLFWNIQLPGYQRRLLLTVFTAEILTTIASIVHVVYILRDAVILISVTGYILVSLRIFLALQNAQSVQFQQADVSLLVSNLLVIVPLCYRVFRKDEQDEGSEDSSSGLTDAYRSTTARATKPSGIPPQSSGVPPRSSAPLTDISTMHSALFLSVPLSASETGSTGHMEVVPPRSPQAGC